MKDGRGMLKYKGTGTVAMKVDTVGAQGLQEAPDQAQGGSTRPGARRPPQDGCGLTQFDRRTPGWAIPAATVGVKGVEGEQARLGPGDEGQHDTKGGVESTNHTGPHCPQGQPGVCRD